MFVVSVTRIEPSASTAIWSRVKKLPPEVLAEVNDALRDALISAARGEPSVFPINEMVHIPVEEAQRICKKIGLDWETGKLRDVP